jgi:glycine cleavage system H lipoate-binding protein
MKHFITLAISLLVATLGLIVLGSQQEATNERKSLVIFCSEDLGQLSMLWASEYNKTHQGISVVMSTEEPAADSKALRIIPTGNVQPGPGAPHLITVCREVVVPVINRENPYINELYRKGIEVGKLSFAVLTASQLTWGALLEEGKEGDLQIYVSDDNTVRTSVTGFLGAEPSASMVVSPAEFLNTIQNNKYAIGFCRLGSIVDPLTMELIPGLRLLPIDRNANGQLDYMESIYGNLNEFNRGVWIGKYPHSLVSNVYAVSEMQPGEEEARFLEWVLTNGQVYLSSFGYSELAGSERLSQLVKLHPIPAVTPMNAQNNIFPVAWYILAGMVFIAILILFSRRKRNKEIKPTPGLFPSSIRAFCEDCLMAPRGVFYDKTHTWAFREKDGTVKVGIDDFLGHVTGTVTGVETKRPGQKIRKGEEFLSIIQRGKKISLYSPVSGRITEMNTLLAGEPGLLGTSPYDKGWVYLVEPSNWAEEVKLLQSVEKYTAWLNTEFKRLKDFLAATLPPRDVQLTYVVLQDGGMLKEGVLEDLDPEIWQEFQNVFIDHIKTN